MSLPAEAQLLHDALARALGYDPTHTTFMPVARTLIGSTSGIAMRLVPEDIDESRPYVAKVTWLECGDSTVVFDRQFGYQGTWPGWKLMRGDTVRLRDATAR